ncbi:hypothetical protein [Croceitalea rosinachiae]|uniref:Uncharacterized protein n=1 Tax=Croceitalea rosinachiae TaxID=3075596 RepID=A0ABU3ABL6_9FLAO|nr:hypothetical protein [Croceitalea sp. F388]MDT0607569.1 hypothetical protein [Croceitalea sp. F388]
MQFLNKQIEVLSKKKKPSLIRRQISCGIFQEVPQASSENNQEKILD